MNDTRLCAYLTAAEGPARTNELERVLTEVVQPRVRTILAAYMRAEWPIEPSDAEDVVSQVTLRVLRKLLAAMVIEEESVQNVEAYATTLTKNALRDLMRHRSPERTRWKSRLRYLFTHDRRLALWTPEAVAVCGLAAWRDRRDYESRAERVDAAVATACRGRTDVAAATVQSLSRLGRPARLTDFVSAFLAAHPERAAQEAQAAPPADGERGGVEAREYLQILWRELRELPAKQQAALLLNLREPGSGNAVLLFVTVGIATLEEIAAALEMSSAELAELWEQLPLDDLSIAAHLGISRQQVINLRKSARERLTRRMALRSHPRQ